MRLRTRTVRRKLSRIPSTYSNHCHCSWLSQDDWMFDAVGNICFKGDRQIWERCQQKRVVNSKKQRGVPRCHEPSKYPLADLVRCAHCGSVMHGIPSSGRLRYTCGTYNNTSGAQCEHNWIAQDEILLDVIDTILQSILPSVEDLRAHLRAFIEENRNGSRKTRDESALLAEIALQKDKIQRALESVSNAQDEDERIGLRRIYQMERSRLVELEAQHQAVQTTSSIDAQRIELRPRLNN